MEVVNKYTGKHVYNWNIFSCVLVYMWDCVWQVKQDSVSPFDLRITNYVLQSLA